MPAAAGTSVLYPLVSGTVPSAYSSTLDGAMDAYLDHAATTAMRPAAIAAVTEQLARVGNPSSLHGAGRQARRVVEESRERIAEALGARPSEVVFTSGGTEADNLAVKGFFWAMRRPVLVTSAVEHHAVLDPAHWLQRRQGARHVLLGVDGYGTVHPEQLTSALSEHHDQVAVVSVQYANNEVGTLQPIPELAAAADRANVPFHTDAVQALGQVPVDVGELFAAGVHAITISGHKIGGPLGVGALLLRRETTPDPLLHGGGQERDVRSGTLDAPAIAGFAAAVAEAAAEQQKAAVRLAELRDLLIHGVLERVPDARIGGDPERRLPGNAHLAFPGCEGDALLLLLDSQRIACSTGSACSAGVSQPSHVLLAMGYDPNLARGALRFSLGHTSTRAEVDRVLEVIGAAVERARDAGFT